jgi:glycosyltransferase involved in cell wall biosynthesis
MRVLVFPRDDLNPYQRLLYGEMGRHGARVTYLGRLTPSHTLNLLLLPAELAARRITGGRLVHLHWVFGFSPRGGSRFPFLRRLAQLWFTVWLRTIRVLGMRLAWTAHNVLPHARVFADDAAARRTLVRASDLVIVHSPAVLAELAALGAAAHRAAVIPHGPFGPAAAGASLRLPGSSDRTRQLLFFGKVEEYKGVDDLLVAMAALPGDVPVRLTVAGQCADPALRSRLRRLARTAGGRVVLRLERVPEDEVTSLLAASDVVVLPFRRITTSGSCLLALAHGRPLIVPDLAALAELPPAAVIRYDGSIPSLVAALTDAARVSQPDLAAMSAAATAYASSTSWPQIAARTLSEMASLLGPSAGAPTRAHVMKQCLRATAPVTPAKTIPSAGIARPVRIAVIIPAGPRDDILDTLASVVQYTDPSRVILVIDDTCTLHARSAQIRELSGDIVVIPAPATVPGVLGGLWVKVTAGYTWVLERYRPGIILRMDADALMLGNGIEAAAEEAFASQPGVGMLGSCRLDPAGTPRDFSPTARILRAEEGVRGLTHPRCRSLVRHYARLARQRGYIDGEHALGAAYVHSYQAASCLRRKGWLNEPRLAPSKLADDHLMSLLTLAAGFRIADFGGPGDPLALKWRGLPAHPSELLADGKLITHSVRSWGDLSERQIRSIFAEARATAGRTRESRT